MAALLMKEKTDSQGNAGSGVLAPGEYLVFAWDQPFLYSPAEVSALWRASRDAQKVTVPARGSVTVTLQLK